MCIRDRLGRTMSSSRLSRQTTVSCHPSQLTITTATLLISVSITPDNLPLSTNSSSGGSIYLQNVPVERIHERRHTTNCTPAGCVRQSSVVKRIPPVMSGTVGDEGDELGVVLFGFAGLCGKGVEEQVDEVDVAQLVVPADVVDGTRSAFAQNEIDGMAVVFDVQPVADVEAVAIDGDGFPCQGFLDGEGDELLGVLAGTVVVGTAGDQGGHAIRAVVGLGHHVPCCL